MVGHEYRMTETGRIVMRMEVGVEQTLDGGAGEVESEAGSDDDGKGENGEIRMRVWMQIGKMVLRSDAHRLFVINPETVDPTSLSLSVAVSVRNVAQSACCSKTTGAAAISGHLLFCVYWIAGVSENLLARADLLAEALAKAAVCHAVARHSTETMTKNLWFATLQLVLYQFVTRNVVNTVSNVFLRLPFSRRIKIEPDHIGLLLVASAGYDPKVCATVYEKLSKVTGGDSALRDHGRSTSYIPGCKSRTQG
ncbi:hypothetical protein C1H46_036220 [Malus baccata]|uniref:Uncharacterized protein n=1 Tax=Malus baccata TaxID=106549 RepID=A0A540KVS2_MALBA|nr:hypothetical protein C1H46_036220 [Malus baccata]